MYSYDGITWAFSSNATAVSITNKWPVAWNGTQWLAGGVSSTPIAYSPDGIYWTGAPTAGFLGTSVRCMAWNGSYWIAMGATVVGISYDGINWRSNAALNIDVKELVWNGIVWLAGGLSGTAYSFQGSTWVTVSTGVSSVRTVAWNGFLWLVGGNTIAFSSDAISWTTSTSATSIFAQGVGSIGWNGSLWVAGGGNGTVSKIGYSTDGSNWNEASSGSALFSSGTITAIRWNGSRWIAGGNGSNAMAFSYNGLNWSNVPSANSLTNFCSGLEVRKTSLYPSVQKPLTENFTVAVNVQRNRLTYSYDGITWTPSTSGTALFAQYAWALGWNGIQWVAGGNASISIIYSPDGINWTAAASSSLFGGEVRALAWNGSFWIAIGFYGGPVGRSYDGVNWTSVATLNIAARAIAWNGIMWIAGGSAAYYSYNGVDWVGLTTGISSIATISWNGSLWLIGGNTIAYSSNGFNWTTSTSATSLFTVGVGAIGWNGSLWVAGGGNGTGSTMGYSIDGITWTRAPTGSASFTPGIISSIIWNGSQWIAGGNGANAMAYSYDGITWAAVASANSLTTDCSVVAARRTLPYTVSPVTPPLSRSSIINKAQSTRVVFNTIQAYVGSGPALYVGSSSTASITVFGRAIFFATDTTSSAIASQTLTNSPSSIVSIGTGALLGATLVVYLTDNTNTVMYRITCQQASSSTSGNYNVCISLE